METPMREHTCGGPSFGRLTAGCPRCDDLQAGADPVSWGRRTYRSDSNYTVTTEESIDRRDLMAKLRQDTEQLGLEVRKLEMWKEAKANVERLRKEIREATEELLTAS